jgi:transposase
MAIFRLFWFILMKKPIPEKIDLTEEDANQLIERISASNLSCDDIKIVVGVIHFCLWLQTKLVEAKITIRKLSKFFGVCSEKRPIDNKNSNPVEANEGSLNSQTEAPVKNDESQTNNKKKGKNNGRLPASDYKGATKIEVKHPSLASGDPCPLDLCTGRVYPTKKPGNIIRIVGGKMAEAKHYILEKLRCNVCGALFSATLPKEAGVEKYDARFKATLAVHKYFLGLPFYRMERMQSYLGVPLPDSTQWHLVEQTADSVYPVFYYLEYLGAQGKAIFIDDTGVKIISVKLAIKENPELKRTGTFTTAIISKVGEHKIYLFYSGKKHAGENATALLKKRNQDLDQVLYMCDALPSNVPDFIVIMINCLAHARREFIDVEAYFPQECAMVIKSLASVYKHDKETKEQQLSDEDRLLYHQNHSKPIMDQLKIWAERQFNEGLVEPNSGLGKAINYMLKRWKNLTRFLEVAGAALDNNCCEEILKIPIRVRKNSAFFATLHGAFVGGMLTSLIVTAARADVNPVEYLTALQQYKTQVFKNPQDWLPWNYEKTILKLQAITSSLAA